MRARPSGTRGLADLIADSFTLFVKNARVFLALGILGALLSALDKALIQTLTDAIGLKIVTSDGAAHLSGGSPFGVLAVGILQVMTAALQYFVGNALIMPAALEGALGKKPSIGSAVVAFRYSLPALLLAWLIIGLLLTGMLISLVLIPLAIILTVRWSFIVQVIQREGLGAAQARRRSSEIVKGFWWRVFLMQIIIAVVGTIPLLVLTPVSNVLNNVVADYALAAIAAWLAIPFTAIARTMLYADIRLRKGEQLRTTPAVAG